MSRHLIAISVGPVQDFIAAARKTRDLWFGSFLLSEISKAVARTIVEYCHSSDPKSGELGLIFPAPKDLSKLVSSKDSDSQYLSVANVVLALISGDPAAAAKAARKAANEEWRNRADDAFARANDQSIGTKERRVIRVSETLWKQQVDDVVEFHAAWVSLNDDDQYKSQRDRVMRLLQGRKACRIFKPAPQWYGLPKSSLDGARETVLAKDCGEDGRLRLRSGEQLDAVGVTKRLAGGRRQYPSVTRVAVDPWLRGIVEASKTQTDVRRDWEELKKACESLSDFQLSAHRFRQYYEFPYEGIIVLRKRWLDLMNEAGSRKDDQQKALKGLEGPLERLEKKFSEPGSYVAILKADGDAVGAAISKIKNFKDHQKLSETLAEFASEAEKIVNSKDAYGTLIYAGGDDVLAILPVDRAFCCAKSLHEEFAKFAEKLPTHSDNVPRPTLSVGIAIGHCMEPLEDLRRWADEAEREAKSGGIDGKKDALAVHIRTRGGPPIQMRRQWTPKDSGPTQGPVEDLHCWEPGLLAQAKGNQPTRGPVEDLHYWAERFLNDELADKVAYDLRKLASDYGDPQDWENGQCKAAMLSDAKRLLKAKTQGTGERKKIVLQELCKLLDSVESPEHLAALCSELLIARKLGEAMRQAKGRPSL